jgi:hypothetical protein
MELSKRELIMSLVERLATSDNEDTENLLRQLDVLDNIICEVLDIDKSQYPSYIVQ